MARRPNSLEKQILELVDLFGPELAKAFWSAISDIRDTTILASVIAAVEVGDITAAFEAMGFSEAAMRPLTAMIERAFETAGNTTTASFPRRIGGVTRGVFRFDIRNVRAEKWLRDHSSTLVTRIRQDQMDAIRSVLDQGMLAGRNPRSVALDIIGRIDKITGRRSGGIVGLTGQQAQWVANARAELSDPSTAANWLTRARRDRRFDWLVRKSIDNNVPLDADTISRLTGRYADSLLQLRGETIARTEALQSLNQAQNEAFRQSVDQGLIAPENVTRIWDSAGNDGRTRHSHLLMDGQTVRLDEPFTTPDGAKMLYPGDSSLGAPASEIINCRCVVKHRVDFLAGVT